MRKWTAFVLVLLMIALLPVSAFATDFNAKWIRPVAKAGLDVEFAPPAVGGHTIMNAEFPLYYSVEESGRTLKLFFLDGAEDLPYLK